MKKYEFHDPKLQAVYEESKPIVEAHLKKLDQISKDIKNLESFLRTSNLGLAMVDFPDASGNIKMSWDMEKKRILVDCDKFLNRPLLECPAWIRLTCHPKLAELLPNFEKGETK